MNSFYFANAAGFWALLGVPAVLLIHLLQQKTRRLPVSTLFLLQNLAPESIPGRSLQKLRRSVPLALQLLLVLLLAWMLAEPRWLRPESSQTLVVMLDSSASMSAFREDAAQALKAKLPDWEKGVAHTDWVLMESDGRKPLLYRGGDRAQFLAALASWRPGSVSHDLAPALELAQAVRGGQGRIVAVTDHEAELPAGIGLLAVGRPLANVGFSGVAAEQGKDGPRWRAAVQNYSDAPQTRTWRMEGADSGTAPEPLRLEPRQVKVLGGSFPPGRDRIELVLQEDAFPLDDRLPVILPSPKPLAYILAAGGQAGHFFQRLAEGVPALASVPDQNAADVAVVSRRLGQPVRESGSAILFYAKENTEGTYNPQPVVAEDHPLVRGVNWQGFLGGGPGLFELADADRVLLWQGNLPLVLLREKEKSRVLIFNFDFEHSNAARLPAFVVLVNRFLDSVRAKKAAAWAENYETNQPLKVVSDPDLGPVNYSGPEGKETLSAEQAAAGRAPGVPGFFALEQGKKTLLSGAAHFGDPREADLGEAASVERLLAVSNETLRKNTEADPLVPVWILLALAALGLSWWWQSPLRAKPGATA